MLIRGSFGQASGGELVRFRDVAAEAFREMDPEAGYVFVAAKDSSGYPAVYQSEDGTRVEASSLWPKIIR